MRTLKLYLTGTGTLVLSLFSFLASVQAEVVTLRPAHDTTLMEVAPDHNNGAEGWFIAGTTQNNTRNRALLQFDFTGAIPANALITSVDLLLDVTRVPSAGFAISPFSLHRTLVSWGEGDKIAIDNNGGQGAPATAGDATWNNRFFAGLTWGTPGGAVDVDYAELASAQTYIYGTGDSPYHFAGSQLLADVQDWVNDSQANFGWMLKSDDEATAFTARRFGAREDALGRGPVLTVEFEVPEPSTLALWGLGLTGLAGGRWWARRRDERRAAKPQLRSATVSVAARVSV